MTDRNKYLDAVLEITGGEAWKTIQEVMKDDIRNVETQELQVSTWEEVLELRGFRRALIYVHDFRNLAKLEKHNNAL